MTRNAKAKRFKKFRKDASILSVTRTIEQEFGLPIGSVRIEYPSGRKARIDSTVGNLALCWSMDDVGVDPIERPKIRAAAVIDPIQQDQIPIQLTARSQP